MLEFFSFIPFTILQSNLHRIRKATQKDPSVGLNLLRHKEIDCLLNVATVAAHGPHSISC